MPDPIRIPSGSARKPWARSVPDDSCTPSCFRTGSVWPKPNTVSWNQIRSGLVLHNTIRDICGRTQLSLKVGRLRAGCVLPEAGPMILVHQLVSRARSVWPKPDQATQIGSGPVLHNLTQTIFGRTEPNGIQEVRSGIYGDVARFCLHVDCNGNNYWP